MNADQVCRLSDGDFASLLRSFPRERSEEGVRLAQRDHDRERGTYVPHEGHHTTGEAGH